MRRLMLYLMTGLCVASATAQNVTYNHDSAKQNQFTVAEIGSGSLTPDLYYNLLHNSYRKTASAKNKLLFRTTAGIAGYRQVDDAEKLDSAMTKRAEIEALRKAIKEELYPFDSITLSKRKTVHELYDRYLALSEYDRAQLEASDIEGLVKSKTQADNLFAALVTGICVGAVAVSVAVWLFFNIRKRKKLKALNAMPESDE